MKQRDEIVKLRETQVPFFVDHREFPQFDVQDDFPESLLLLSHRRGGKTTGVALDVCSTIMNIFNEKEIFKFKKDVDSYNPLLHFYAKTKIQARDIVWGELAFRLQRIPGIQMKRHTLTIVLPRPHIGDEITFKLMSSAKYDTARGSKLRKAWLDEVQLAPEDAVMGGIGPALKDCMGRLALTGTVNGRGVLFDLAQMFLETKMPFYMFPVTRTTIFDQDEIKRFARESVGGSFDREYMLDFFAPVTGALYAPKMAQLEREPWWYEGKYDPALPLLVAFDIGVGSAFSAWVFQIRNDVNQIHIVGYYEDYQTLGDFQADILDDGFNDPDYIIAPHDVKQKQFSGVKQVTNKSVIKEVFPHTIIRDVKKPAQAMASVDNAVRHLHLLRFPDLRFACNGVQLGYAKLKEYSRKKNTITGVFEDSIDKTKGIDHTGDALRIMINGLGCKDGRIRFVPRKITEAPVIVRTQRKYLRNKGRVSNFYQGIPMAS